MPVKPNLEIPEDLLFRSYKLMMAGAGFESPNIPEYAEAVQELISALRERGWLISPSASDIPRRENTDNRGHKGNSQG